MGEIVFACSTKIFQSRVTRPTQTEVHEELVEAVLTAPMDTMTPTVVSEASNLLSQGTQIIDTKLFSSVFLFAYGAMNLIVILLILGSQHIVGLVLLPLCGSIIYAMHTAMYPFFLRMDRVEETISQALCASFSEAISGAAHIRAFQWQDFHWERAMYIIDQAQKVYRYSLAQERLESFLTDLTVALMAILTTAIGVRYTSDTYKVGISIYVLTQLRPSFKGILVAWRNLNTCASVLERSDRLTTTLQQVDPIFQTVLPSNWPRHGRVEFRNVVISPAHPENLNLTINRLTIPHRADAGIVGNPFTGKTALLMAMQGMIPYEGSIIIDGIEAREVPSDKIRDAFTVIPQAPVIIRNGTIRQNLIPHEVVLDAVRDDIEFQRDILTILIDMGLTRVIEQCGGLNAQFSKLRLTKAQLQRFAMAQGLMKFYFKATRFVLNDSALSTVDSETLSRMSEVSKRSFRFAGATVIQTASHLPALEDGSWLATINGDGLVREATWFTNNHNHQNTVNAGNGGNNNTVNN